MFYPQEIIDQVLDSNNIVEVVGSYVKLTKKGSTYFGLCPFHSEKTPSFSVTDKGNRSLYYCFGCHKGGNALTFVMKYENCSYTEAVKKLADRAGLVLPQPQYSKEESEKAKKREALLDINKESAKYFYKLLKSERGRLALQYLNNRGISNSTILNFGLGYSDKYRDDLYLYLKHLGYDDESLKNTGLISIKENDTHDYFWNRVMFPIMDVQNRVIAFGGRVMGEGQPKYLNSPETDCFNKRRTLYGLHIAKKHKGDSFILCEGYMDVIALHQAGFDNAVASLGTAFTEGHAGLLKRYTDTVYLSYDSDTAGRDAALRAIPMLKSAGISVKIIDLLPYKDPDELIQREGKEEYKKRITNAKFSIIFELECLREKYDLSDPDKKTKFYNEVAHKLGSCADEIEMNNYIDVISKSFDLEKDLLKSKAIKIMLTNEGLTDNIPSVQLLKKKDDNINALESCQKLLLSWMANDLKAKILLDKYISAEDFFGEPYERIAELLFNQMKSGKVNMAYIIGAFEDTEMQETVADTLSYIYNRNMSIEDMKKALNDSVIRIKKNSIGNKMINEKDVNQILALKKEQESLAKLQIFGGNG